MIDIIIPVYNSQKSIVKTLASVAIQSIKDKAKIYIIDDCSDDNYDKELSIFKDLLDITYLRLDKNMGPGVARQFGIDNSNGEYIVFLDSDDQLYNYFSLEILYKEINNNKLDVVLGYYYIEENNSRHVSNKSYMFGSLHGKIYRRKHLIDNKIRFKYNLNLFYKKLKFSRLFQD